MNLIKVITVHSYLLVDPVTTPSPCAVKCNDGTCISGEKVCDFVPDCAQGDDKTDMSDEKDCDHCDFELGIVLLLYLDIKSMYRRSQDTILHFLISVLFMFRFFVV